jgi:hypothetical protein
MSFWSGIFSSTDDEKEYKSFLSGTLSSVELGLCVGVSGRLQNQLAIFFFVQKESEL